MRYLIMLAALLYIVEQGCKWRGLPEQIGGLGFAVQVPDLAIVTHGETIGKPTQSRPGPN